MQLQGKQKDAFELSITNEFSKMFITGGAGTGKSFIINSIVGELKKRGIPHKVIAPTNMAVKNLNELSNIDEAQTLHKFFELTKNENFEANDECNFIVFDRFNMDFDLTSEDLVLIVDEASMIGAKLLNKTIESVEASKVILVGDLNQLPPVKDKPVNWREYVSKVVELDVNYRAKNKIILDLVNRFVKTKSLAHIPIFTDTNNLDDYYFIAYKNRNLSVIQKHFEGRDYLIAGEKGRLHSPLSYKGEIVYHNGEVVDILEEYKYYNFETIYDNKIHITDKEFNNLITRYASDLKEYDNFTSMNNHIRVNKVKTPDNIGSELYHFDLLAISGDYRLYKLLLDTNYELFRLVMIRLSRVYNTTRSGIWKLYRNHQLNHLDELALKESYRAYMKIKNSAYARKHNYITTYKAQGQSLSNVVVYEPDLYSEPKHAYIAVSRAMNKLYKIK